MSVSDGELVAAVLQGDRTAFAVLLQRHRDMVTALCRRFLGDHVAAEDALQEAAVTAWLNLARLRDADRFGPWLAGIALNVCRGWRRYQAREAWCREVLAGGRACERPPREVRDPADLVECRQLSAALRAAVDTLPPGQRDAVVGYYLQGLTQAEVALLLGTTTGAVKTRLHNARRALRGLLVHIVEEEAMASPAAVRMDVATVCQLAPTDSGISRYVVVLDERGGDRRLPIWVGEHEGIALAFALQQAELPRPLTHQLTASLLEAAGARVKAARITRLAELTFYATVTLQTPAGERQVDARPSDALVLALLTDAEVSVDESVLQRAAAQACATAPPDADQVEREALARAPEIVSARLALMQRLREQAPRR